MNQAPRRVLVTGAAGYLGSELLARLHREPARFAVVACDVRPVAVAAQWPGIEYQAVDVRSQELLELCRRFRPQSLVHLASIVHSRGPAARAFEHSVDVGGTANVLAACRQFGVEHLVVTSSGAAYGYHADNAVPLTENCPLRGNREFAYSDHKRQVEELLARARTENPGLAQLVLRVGTILGSHTDNPITRLFRGRFVLGVRGCRTPFVFVWDQDVVECIAQGVDQVSRGIYNVAGDGTLSLAEIARRLHKPYVAVPAGWLRLALRVLRAARLSQLGPEQVLFLQYRPVLDNTRLKAEFGYRPQKTTAETFEFFLSQGRKP